eukprot:TRINITY_DN113951_c0_g1_i1.p1 TRINITY_DN113951_c0_g1~~TRINITY_DN113951_c0_g1_i1.p1  ORF type:complete len:193 (-),score=42.23 TRINITY_DN113951_c0_g1_i1:88-618(-)
MREACQALLQCVQFVEVCAKDVHGHTALHYAAAAGHVDICQMLLSDRRFDEQDAASLFGHTALHLGAELSSCAEVCQVLLDCPAFTAADAVDARGRTALHCAALAGNRDACRTLMDHQRFSAAAVKAVDDHGSSALELASSEESRQVLSSAFGSGYVCESSRRVHTLRTMAAVAAM